jgi:hypothetical protein
MTRRHTIGVVGAAAAAAALLGALSGSAQSTGARTITLKENEHGADFAAVDHPPRSRSRVSLGDQFVIALPARERGGGGRSGTVSGRCSAIQAATQFARASWQCDTVVSLPDGTVITQGIFRASDPTTTLAVTGGTGAYDGVTGTMVSRRADGGDVDVIRLR